MCYVSAVSVLHAFVVPSVHPGESIATSQCIQAGRRGQDNWLKVKPSFGMKEEGDLSEVAVVVGARQASLSIPEPADLLGSSLTTISRVYSPTKRI